MDKEQIKKRKREWQRQHYAHMTIAEKEDYLSKLRERNRRYYEANRERIRQRQTDARKNGHQRSYKKPVPKHIRFCPLCNMPMEPTWRNEDACHRHRIMRQVKN